jgi:hypothetical protein
MLNPEGGWFGDLARANSPNQPPIMASVFLFMLFASIRVIRG